MGIFDKAKDFAQNNPDKVGQAVDRAGDMVDERTGGQYAGQVDQAQDALKGQFGGGQAEPSAEAPADQTPAEETTTDPGPAGEVGFGEPASEGGLGEPAPESAPVDQAAGGEQAPAGEPAPEGGEQQF